MAEEEATGAEARRKADGYLYLTLMVAISSTTAWAAKSAVRELPVGLMPPLRFGAAGLCLLPLIGSGGAGTLRRMLREDPVRLLLAAAPSACRSISPSSSWAPSWHPPRTWA